MTLGEHLATAHDELSELTGEIARLEAIFDAWDLDRRSTALSYGRSIEAVHAVALKRLVLVLKSDPAAAAALKSAVCDEAVYAVFRRHNLVKPSLNERIEAALDTVRGTLAEHGGNVELVRLVPPMVELRLTGSCDGCAASQLTFQGGVIRALNTDCPEITDIRLAKSRAPATKQFASPFAPEAEEEWREAGRATDIPDGGVLSLQLGGQSLFLARVGDAIACYTDSCVHLGQPLSNGRVANGTIICPHHGFAYELSSGQCLTADDLWLERREVRLFNGRVEIKLSR